MERESQRIEIGGRKTFDIGERALAGADFIDEAGQMVQCHAPSSAFVFYEAVQNSERNGLT